MTGEQRSEKATDRRLREARERGKVALSRDLTAAIVLLAAGVVVAWMAGDGVRLLHALFENVATRSEAPSHTALLDGLADAWDALVAIVFPLGITGLAVAVAMPMIQARPLPSWEPLRPKVENIDPFRRLKQMFFSLQGWLEFVRTCLKLSVLALVCYAAIHTAMPVIASTALVEWEAALAIAKHQIARLVIAFVVAFIVFSAADVFYQRWMYARGLRMSKSELRRELRDDEGTPELEYARRKHREDIENMGSRVEIRGCSVLVANPTHLACALRYDPSSGAEVPELVAKAEGLFALQLRETAEQEGVPVREDRPLARALFELPIREPIPPELYEAVAEVLRWALDLDRRTAHRPSSTQRGG